jgi:quercetin dioxygenase-like cupin family protein
MCLILFSFYLCKDTAPVMAPAKYSYKLAYKLHFRINMTTPTGGAPMEKKSMNLPDEIRTFEKGKLELTTFKNGTTIGRITLEPGWSWDKCVKPIVKTNSCQAPHIQYMISRRIKVIMDDGSEEEFGPGDTAVVPPGHNAWVVGNETVVGIDFTGLNDYAKEGGPQAQ